MWGIGKKRSKIGKFIDKHGYSQEDLCKVAKIGRNTASRICSDPQYSPSLSTIQKVMKAIRKIDPNAKADDFFDM
ncbi:helix-turn-helix domain-containing protein [Bacillus weihaiensis]|uniref:XRE family transcriptional regulator n=1 Tax=Bacillus weihaiensis TaxID=1547283 RepID=A0A1L3MXY9_9BACI|nr:helix-turn-helix transcriptional regulator [Bacillus weihaiensis]APH07209.1 XRE family transcriptional regulator [Bacillus weihaiensis]